MTTVIVEQDDFFTEIPLPDPTQPYEHTPGLWCCPRCWRASRYEYGCVSSLIFGPPGEYRVGHCRCGYWARFLRRFGDGDPLALAFGEKQ